MHVWTEKMKNTQVIICVVDATIFLCHGEVLLAAFSSLSPFQRGLYV